jgi:hypothetical protein
MYSTLLWNTYHIFFIHFKVQRFLLHKKHTHDVRYHYHCTVPSWKKRQQKDHCTQPIISIRNMVKCLKICAFPLFHCTNTVVDYSTKFPTDVRYHKKVTYYIYRTSFTSDASHWKSSAKLRKSEILRITMYKDWSTKIRTPRLRGVPNYETRIKKNYNVLGLSTNLKHSALVRI